MNVAARAGIFVRCLRCRGIFIIYSHYIKNNSLYSEFQCNCGRIIKVIEERPQDAQSNVVADTISMPHTKKIDS